MRPLLLAAFALLTPVMALAGMDQPWNETDDGGNGSVIVGLVVLGIFAFIIHLVEKGEFLGFLKDVAKGVSFLATMYLGVFFFLVCMLVIFRLLQAFGMPQDTAGFIAFPSGLFAALKLFGVYQYWRNPKPKDMS